MCLYIGNNQPKIAKRDIICYKLVEKSADGRYRSFYKFSPIKLGKMYTSELTKFSSIFYGDDKDLVEVVELLGDKANGSYAKLRIVEIPDDVNFVIEEYDGIESIHEAHRSW